MKTFRVLGAIFCVFGCFFALLGILTSIFPMIENEQFKLILHSFQETSADPLTNTLNSIVRFCLHSSYFLLFTGISLMVAGGLISSAAHKRMTAAKQETVTETVSPTASGAPGVPKPAYYPGGLAPPTVRFHLEKEESEPQARDLDSASKPGPISGGIEPSFSSDENDAQKLMHHDQILTAQRQSVAPPAPEYSQYLSNTVPEAGGEDQAVLEEEASESAQPSSAEPQGKPRIISTMGKRRL